MNTVEENPSSEGAQGENIKEGCINNCNTSASEDQVQKENPEHY